MIAIDLSKANYQTLLITYLELTIRNVNHAWKEKKIKSECRKKKCSKLINKGIRNFPVLYLFCNGDLNKFVLLLRKCFYPYEYMNSLEKVNDTLIPPKEAYYSKLNEEDIRNADYAHVRKVWEVFKIKDIG